LKKKEEDMQVALFRALSPANIDDEAAAKAVVVVEEQIDMAVSRAVQPMGLKIDALEGKIGTLEGKITSMQTGLEARLDAGLKGMQTSIDGLKWYVIITGSVMTFAIALGGGLTAWAQFIK
jgi:hypothetical protein